MLRRIEPSTAILVLLCIGWTLVCRTRELTYAEAGALRTQLLWEGEYHRILTAAFLHHMTFWLHLGANAVGLFFIGTIVARECGRVAYLSILFLSVCGGWSAGMLWYEAETWQMGISGGILGLIGALIAVEWAHARSLGEFFRARNTWVLIATVVIGAVLTWYMNKYTAEAMNLVASQAGHAGGLVVGLVTGIAWFGRRGRRPVLGVIVGLLVGIAPVAYCAFPVNNVDFVLFRANRAYRAGDKGAATAFYEQARRLDPGHPLAGARLALLEKDPAYLDGLRTPQRAETGFEILRAYLTLANERLAERPDEVEPLLAAAERLPFGGPDLWNAFGHAAQQANRPEFALRAFEQAMLWQPNKSEAWAAAGNTLGPYLLRLRQAHHDGDPASHFLLCVRAVNAAKLAAPGLVREDVPDTQREELEKLMFETARSVALLIQKFPEDHPKAHDLDLHLAQIFWLLANNTEHDERRPGYLYLRAGWLARSVVGTDVPEDLVRAFRGAWEEAREAGDKRIQAEVEQWFRNRGLPVPKPELAEDDDDG